VKVDDQALEGVVANLGVRIIEHSEESRNEAGIFAFSSAGSRFDSLLLIRSSSVNPPPELVKR
jgi:hypothetical protein